MWTFEEEKKAMAILQLMFHLKINYTFCHYWDDSVVMQKFINH